MGSYNRIVLVGFLGAALSVPVFAGTQPNAVIVLHATAHTAEPGCDEVATLSCENYVLSWPLNTAADLYLVVANGYAGPGIAGVSCGISYNHGVVGGQTRNDGEFVDVLAWTLCASGLQFPNGPTGKPQDEWPASGGGNRITWDRITDCQNTSLGHHGVHAVAGVFYVYAYAEDAFQITQNRNLLSGYELVVMDCDALVTHLPTEHAGYIQFGDPGSWEFNPCDFVAVRPTSWGRLKRQY